jgi:hypothetical protein
MRHISCALALGATVMSLNVLAALPAWSEQTELNRLDCQFDEETKSFRCPPSQAQDQPRATEGRASTGAPPKGSLEWKAYCAEKYKSFDADTGFYRSFSGKQRECE